MRLAAVEKVGYYPTQDRIYELISTHLKRTNEFARIFDPCAGTGKAVHHIAAKHNLRSYGVEISHTRSEKAKELLDEVINAPIENVQISNSSISVLFLNPPYETINNERMELKFLRLTTPKLVDGGILIYIIQKKQILSEKIANYILEKYENIALYDYPLPERTEFGQTVLFATKRSLSIDVDQQAIKEWLDKHEDLPVLMEGAGEYKIPASPLFMPGNRQFVFKINQINELELIEQVQRNGLIVSNRIKDIVCVEKHRSITEIQPVMPLKKGHLSMLIASGMLGNMRIDTKDGSMVIKGKVEKVEVAPPTGSVD